MEDAGGPTEKRRHKEEPRELLLTQKKKDEGEAFRLPTERKNGRRRNFSCESFTSIRLVALSLQSLNFRRLTSPQMKPLCAATRPTSISRIQRLSAVNLDRSKALSQRHFGAPLLRPCRAAPSSSSSLGKDEREEKNQPQTTTSNKLDKSSDAYYLEALSKARECIFSAPPGQLLGRAGRRCTLEDGERHALRAVAARPGRAAEASLLLARSLVAQGRGREIEVPRMVVEALKATDADCLSAEIAVALIDAAGVAFEKGAGATTGFASVELFVKAVSEAVPPAAGGGRVREAVEAAAAAVAARTEVAKERARREEAAVER